MGGWGVARYKTGGIQQRDGLKIFLYVENYETEREYIDENSKERIQQTTKTVR